MQRLITASGMALGFHSLRISPPLMVLANRTSYHKGMAVFIDAKRELMCEATVGGQKFSLKAKE